MSRQVPAEQHMVKHLASPVESSILCCQKGSCVTPCVYAHWKNISVFCSYTDVLKLVFMFVKKNCLLGQTDAHAAGGGTWGSSAPAWADRSPEATSAWEILGAHGKTWPTPCSSCTLSAQPPTCGGKTQRVSKRSGAQRSRLWFVSNDQWKPVAGESFYKTILEKVALRSR